MTEKRILIESYDQIFNNMPDGFALFRIIRDKSNCASDYEYLYFNKAYASMTGTKASFLMGHSALEIFGYVDTSALEKYDKVSTTGEPMQYERFIESSQKYYKYNIFTPEKGYFAVLITDITRLKKNELNLRASEEKFRELSENIQEIYWLWAKEKLLYVSPAYEKIWGCEVRSLYEKPDSFTHYIHPDDRNKFLLKYKKFESSGQFDEEYRIIRPDGEMRWIWARYFPVLNEKGVMYRYAGVAQDITRRKQIEHELILARDKAEESDKLKSAFLANMSHEIRTPMNGILGLAQFLKDPDLPAQERDMYIDLINNSGKLLMNIINDIIDIAKIEAGQISISKADCNIGELLNTIVKTYRARLVSEEKTGVEIMLIENAGGGECIAVTDAFRLQQILNNLVGNAYKYTSQGSIEISWMLENDHLKFIIADTGIGIPEEKHKVIFERFSQVDYTSTRQYGGTGLGLAISKGLTELLGGSIGLASSPGKGSTFWFTIPYEKSSHTAPVVAEAPAAKAATYNWKGKCAVVVEDDDINYKVIEIFLRKTAITLLRFNNGKDAVEYIRQEKPADVVLMDIQLPGMDGYTATRKIKKHKPALPLIIQTAHALVEERQRCIDAGADDFITKPVEAALLYASLSRFL